MLVILDNVTRSLVAILLRCTFSIKIIELVTWFYRCPLGKFIYSEKSNVCTESYFNVLWSNIDVSLFAKGTKLSLGNNFSLKHMYFLILVKIIAPNLDKLLILWQVEHYFDSYTRTNITWEGVTLDYFHGKCQAIVCDDIIWKIERNALKSLRKYINYNRA
jgi:hypothetical protein